MGRKAVGPMWCVTHVKEPIAHLVELLLNGSAFNIGLITVTIHVMVTVMRPMLKAEPLTAQVMVTVMRPMLKAEP